MFEKIANLLGSKTAIQNREKLRIVLNVVIRVLDALDGQQDFEQKKK